MAKRFGFLILIALFLIVTILIPESRRALKLQAMCTASHNTYPWLPSPNLEIWPHDFLDKWSKSGVSAGTDWETDIALAQLYYNKGKDVSKTVEYSRKAVTAGPSHPEAYASAVWAYARKCYFFRSEQIELIGKLSAGARLQTEEADAAAANELFDLSRQGARLDPDNAFFDLMGAYALYGLHQDEKALELVHAAAIKKHYNSYIKEANAAMVKYLKAADMPRTEVYMSDVLTSSLYMTSWPFSNMTVWYAKELDSKGHSREAELLLLDLTRIGALIRKDSSGKSDCSIASDIQSAISRAVRPPNMGGWIPGQEISSDVEGGAKAFTTHGWAELAAAWLPEYKAGSEFKKKTYDYYFSLASPLNLGRLAACAVPFSCLVLKWSFFLLIISGLCWLMLRISFREIAPVSNLSRAGSFRLAIFALVPWLFANAVWMLTYDVEPIGGG